MKFICAHCKQKVPVTYVEKGVELCAKCCTYLDEQITKNQTRSVFKK